jgi:hypothetical protein
MRCAMTGILECVRTPARALPVARASLLRTLRRLWAAGLVELLTYHATPPTLTDQAAYWHSAFAIARSYPRYHDR